MTQLYDTIGVDYGDDRRPDPRVAAAIRQAPGAAAPVVNPLNRHKEPAWRSR